MADLASAQVQENFASATNMLLDHGIFLLEWGDQVLSYWGYPIAVPVYDFAVEDNHLDETVNLLENSDTGFKRIDPPPSEKHKGALGEKGYHFISVDDDAPEPTILHLLPETLVHLCSQDAVHVHSPFDPSRGLFRPKLPQHCVSLIRCMEDYPADSPDRNLVERALRLMLATAVYKLPPMGEELWSQAPAESEESFRTRQAIAINHVKHWKLTEKDEPYRAKVVEYLMSGTI
ncbi:hypothetical protein H072_7522 [Dactylellina haptotyla CBS 200.50]|uniref:Uncharacterized protein n=1 Tax=Dactylellina haptotyla (strain CBS 200.50) TaxID=1284197 RepID=S8A6V2_DACHA|nr:hypothetical protein H072_7522 [Dactylellina haptotyla CBS 200.50]